MAPLGGPFALKSLVRANWRARPAPTMVPSPVARNAARARVAHGARGWMGLFGIAAWMLVSACGPASEDSAAREPSEPQGPAHTAVERTEAASDPDETPSETAAWQWQSRVLYLAAPDDPHRLQVHYADARHGRLRLESDPPGQGRRTLHFLSEQGAFAMGARSDTSQPLSSEEQSGLEQHLALRAALLRLSSAQGWTVESEPQRWIQPAADGARIVAHFEGTAAKPTRLEWQNASGAWSIAFTDLRWEADGSLPIALTFAKPSGAIWNEADIVVRRGLRLQPVFFLPADRRPAPAQTETLPITAPEQEQD